jgi:hypothetical protein
MPRLLCEGTTGHHPMRTIAALALLALATSTANLPLALALTAGGLALGATAPAD